MKQSISDDKLDQVLRTVFAGNSLSDDVLDDVSASPALWHAVRREIDSRKPGAVLPWPPSNILRRWMLIGVPVAAAVVITVAIFSFQGSEKGVGQAGLSTPVGNEVTTAAPKPRSSDVEPSTSPAEINTKVTAPRQPISRTSMGRSVTAARKRIRQTTPTETRAEPEVRSEFIALTYAERPESGQLVRVKVPSSMMVRLGLVASVKTPTSLIDAEVVIGDDGQTHAIRFIR
ncbi:MAG: hypothetical protein AB7J13_09765 [Pyrinomonadaceae bacterium]